MGRKKFGGGGALIRTSNYLKTLLLSLISKFVTAQKQAREEVSNMLFGGSKHSGKKQKNDRLYLFKDGDQCSDVTGEWTTEVEGNGGSYSASLDQNALYIGGSGNGGKYWKPSRNLTTDVLNKFDYIFFEFKARSYDSSNGGDCRFYVGGDFYMLNNRVNRDKTRIVALPLTNTSIKFGIFMSGHSTSYMWVNKVWLEKVGE